MRRIRVLLYNIDLGNTFQITLVILKSILSISQSKEDFSVLQTTMTDHESNHSQSGNFHDGAGVEEQGEINPRMEPGIKNSSPTDPSEPSVSEELELSNDNTMVYALVEVSKDSERTSKRQKIPLSARDFYQVMQKFIDSKKDKSDRKILRPLKRKYGMECGDSNIKIAKAQKQFINSKLANQNPKPSGTVW